uniref:Uncharacterized protein n=1 Tax=Cacopsylla melanoneura TaxID=428564 RepID=A0A8D8USC7_9HEMI
MLFSMVKALLVSPYNGCYPLTLCTPVVSIGHPSDVRLSAVMFARKRIWRTLSTPTPPSPAQMVSSHLLVFPPTMRTTWTTGLTYVVPRKPESYSRFFVLTLNPSPSVCMTMWKCITREV